MDNHIFRGAALGFNRQDVMEYIEKTQKEAETNAASLSLQLDGAMNELAELRRQLEESAGKAEKLANDLEESRRQYEEEHEAREALEQEVDRQCESIRALTEERDHLSGQVRALTGQSEALRMEKEKLAQLELDAHRRADDLLAQTQTEINLRLSEAQTRAEGLISAANTQAADTVAQAQARRESLLQEAETQIESACGQCGELFDACERITTHITSELRKLDVANTQLPIGLGSLRSGLTDLREKARER